MCLVIHVKTLCIIPVYPKLLSDAVFVGQLFGKVSYFSSMLSVHFTNDDGRRYCIHNSCNLSGSKITLQHVCWVNEHNRVMNRVEIWLGPSKPTTQLHHRHSPSPRNGRNHTASPDCTCQCKLHEAPSPGKEEKPQSARSFILPNSFYMLLCVDTGGDGPTQARPSSEHSAKRSQKRRNEDSAHKGRGELENLCEKPTRPTRSQLLS
jgi:hypothetical protein